MEGIWPEVLIGDCRVLLDQMAPESVHAVITSPPYWNLRDYNCAGQIGLEPTFAEHLEVMVDVCRKIRRVLRLDGVFFCNCGDAYACSPNGRKAKDIVNDDRTFRDKPGNTTGNGFKAKDLMLMPHRLAIALQNDGWYIRSEIVWSKLNPLPESVTDRFTRSHEYVFMFTRSSNYYFDQEAVREQSSGSSHGGNGANPGNKQRILGANVNGNLGVCSAVRNKRSVWTLATQPLPFEHYAAFPEALVEPCILASTSERGCCPECGAPWKRIVEKGESQWEARKAKGEPMRHGLAVAAASKAGNFATRERQVSGWQATCTHDLEPVPCKILDPFCGSGTTLRVATNLGRKSIGIDLSNNYLKIIKKRTAQGGLGI